jgi:hypothetical protein
MDGHQQRAEGAAGSWWPGVKINYPALLAG